jgi:hypothetical protein
MNNGFFETLGQTIYGAIREADEARVLLVDPGAALDIMGREPISYNKHRSFDFEIELYRDRKTKKWFHVVISRLDSGRYELVTYVL